MRLPSCITVPALLPAQVESSEIICHVDGAFHCVIDPKSRDPVKPSANPNADQHPPPVMSDQTKRSPFLYCVVPSSAVSTLIASKQPKSASIATMCLSIKSSCGKVASTAHGSAIKPCSVISDHSVAVSRPRDNSPELSIKCAILRSETSIPALAYF